MNFTVGEAFFTGKPQVHPAFDPNGPCPVIGGLVEAEVLSEQSKAIPHARIKISIGSASSSCAITRAGGKKSCASWMPPK
jgi:hypothetical protein